MTKQRVSGIRKKIEKQINEKINKLKKSSKNVQIILYNKETKEKFFVKNPIEKFLNIIGDSNYINFSLAYIDLEHGEGHKK